MKDIKRRRLKRKVDTIMISGDDECYSLDNREYTCTDNMAIFNTCSVAQCSNLLYSVHVSMPTHNTQTIDFGNG